MRIPLPEIMRFVGPPLCESFPAFCGFDKKQTEAAIKLYRSRYSVTGLFENNVYEGIPEMLERLKKGGKRLLVATSKPEEFSVRILDKFGLSEIHQPHLFVFLFVTGAKDVLVYLLERAGITDTSDVLMIGDRMHDIIGAHSLNISCMSVLWGYGDTDEFNKYGTDYIVSEPSELADLLLS